MGAEFDPALADRISIGHEARRMLPQVERFCSALGEETLTDVERQIADGTFTSEMALARWHEVVAYRRIVRRLHQRAVAGEKAAVRLAAGHGAVEENA